MTLLPFSVGDVISTLYQEADRCLIDGESSITVDLLEASIEDDVNLTPVQVGQLFAFAWNDAVGGTLSEILTEDPDLTNPLLGLLGQCLSHVKVRNPACPFCGGLAHTNAYPQDEPGKWAAYTLCTSCGAKGPTVGGAGMRDATHAALSSWAKRTLRI